MEADVRTLAGFKTNRRTFFCIPLILILFPLATSAGWVEIFGGQSDDYGRGVAITDEGNYVVTGTKDNKLWILEVDVNGAELWSQFYVPENDWGVGGHGNCIERTSDGGFIISGRPLLIKTDRFGQREWILDVDEPEYLSSSVSDWVTGSRVIESPDSGYLVAGYGGSGYGYYWVYALKSSSQGDSLWARNYIDVSWQPYDFGNSICPTFDGNYIMAGYKDGFGDQQMWLLKVSPQGDTFWTREYGRKIENLKQYFDEAYSIQQTSDSAFIVCGITQKGESRDKSNLWLLKIDSLGDTIWIREYGSGTGQTGFSVQETKDKGFVITGRSNGDVWLLRTDMDGDTLWTRTYGGPGSDAGFCVKQTPDGGFIIAGQTESFGAGGFDLFLIKTDSLGEVSGIYDSPATNTLISQYEIVPALGSSILLHYSDFPNGLDASIYDASGRKVDEIQSPLTQGTIQWGGDQKPGVYFIVPRGSKSKPAKVVLVR